MAHEELLALSAICTDFRLHFGLGKAKAGDLSVRWPGGKSESFSGVACGQIVTIEEGRGIIRRQAFTSATAH